MRFATRTLLWSFVPAAMLLLACFAAVQRVAVSIVRGGLYANLKQSQAWVRIVNEKSEERSRRVLAVAGENAALKAGLELMYAEAGNETARLTLEDQLAAFCETLACGFLVVSDAEFRPLAGVRRSQGRVEVLDASRTRPPQQGFFADDSTVFHTTSVPINRGNEQLGFLSLGEPFDFANSLASVVLLRHGRVMRSVVDGASAAEIESALSACTGQIECEVRIAGTTYLAMSTDGPHIGEGYALFSLRNLDAELAPVQATLRTVFLFASGAGLLATLALSVLSARSVVRPVQTLITHLRHSESIGALRAFDERSAIHEIRELYASYNRAASAIRETRQRLDRAHVAFIETLASALDARDPYTAGHSKRVSTYSLAIAESLRLSPAKTEEIRVGALLHDIGKIGVPDEVLSKPGILTAEEYRLIQQHPEIGRHILEAVDAFHPYLHIVELHHENWDGTGYPHRLRGEHVPIGARIVHVADAFDAMTSDRPYRRGMSAARALENLRDNAATQFDPDIVAAFCALCPIGEGIEPNLAALAASVGQASWPVQRAEGALLEKT